MAGQEHVSRPPAINRELARSIVESAIRIYFRKRRSRVPRFVEETYSVRGCAEACIKPRHRARSVARAVQRADGGAAAWPHGRGLRLRICAGRTRDAQWLKSRELFVRTTVAQEIERRIVVDLLELPYSGPGKHPRSRMRSRSRSWATKGSRDALSVLEGPWGEDERSRIEALLAENLSIYLNGRAAVNEITSGALTLGAGAVLRSCTN
jgi:hypothetical protein